MKGKVYKTLVRPAMLYSLETVALRKRHEAELDVPEGLHVLDVLERNLERPN